MFAPNRNIMKLHTRFTVMCTVLLFAASLMAGCGNETKESPSDAPNTETEANTNAEVPVSSTPAPVDAASLDQIYGNWTPGDLVGFAEVSAMDETSYATFKSDNGSFEFSAELAKVGGASVESPTYATDQMGAEDLPEEFNISAADLGIEEEAEVTVIKVSQADGSPWTQPGSTLLLQADGKLLSTWDGGFFELVKQ